MLPIPENHDTTTYRNALGEVVEVIDATNASIVYEYDAKGNQTLSDGPLLNDEIVTDYDNFDNIKTINDPNLGLWHYSYNQLGQLEHQVDAKGNCTQLDYDNWGRVTDKYFFETEQH